VRRPIYSGPLSVAVSVIAVLIVRAVAVALLRTEPTFVPLTVTPVVVDTTILTTLAVLVFRQLLAGRSLPGPLIGLLGWRFAALDPVDAFRALALRVLFISFLPDIFMAVTHRAPSRTPLALAVLVTAWYVMSRPHLTRHEHQAK
jgi:hypothetical protein